MVWYNVSEMRQEAPNLEGQLALSVVPMSDELRALADIVLAMREIRGEPVASFYPPSVYGQGVSGATLPAHDLVLTCEVEETA